MTTAVILAGGLGTRLREAVENVPKPMAPIKGRPFLEYQFDYWIAQGVNRFILAIGFMHEKVEAHFGGLYGGARIEYSIEETPLDTGGGLLLAAEKLKSDSPFLVLNGDTYFAVPLDRLRSFSDARNADWCFALFRTGDNERYMGMKVGEDGRILSLGGEKIMRGLANGGVYWVNPLALAESGFSAGEKVSLEKGIFPSAIAAGLRMYGVEISGTFLDIGLPADYYRAPELLGV